MEPDPHIVDVVIIGAGAAGLFCAGSAVQAGLSTVLIEHNDKPGKKIRISGGGRCNFTNTDVTHENFISQNPNFARSALSRYTPNDFIQLVEESGIAYHEKTLGQLFCDGSSQQIIDLLVDRVESAVLRVESEEMMLLGTSVHSVTKSDVFNGSHESRRDQSAQRCRCNGWTLHSKTFGATDLGYRIARQFDITLVQTAPALVPLTFDDTWKETWGELSGVSLPASVKAEGPTFKEALLFTHRGLTGPAILQASSYWSSGQPLTIDLLESTALSERSQDLELDAKKRLRTVLAQELPKRVVNAWSDARLDRKIAEISRADLEGALRDMRQWKVYPTGTEGYAKAEVTRGGVDTSALSSRSMESRQVPGLYFIGEVVDVTGWLGGYNFQWAWSSGHACVEAIAASVD